MICSIIIKVVQQKSTAQHFVTQQKPTVRMQRVNIIDIKKVDKQLTHAMHVKYKYADGTFIDILTKWHQ